jgi:hypothetical protein
MCLQYCDGRTRKDKEGVGCWPRTGVQMACTNKPANSEYIGSGYVISSWDEAVGRWLPSSTATYTGSSLPGVGCRFVCKDGYMRQDGSCVANDVLEWASGPRAACETATIQIGNFYVAKCNVGASQAWDPATETTVDKRYASYGCHFQWGNNYCFMPNLASTQITTSTQKADTSTYGPSSYSSATFIVNQHPRDSSANDNLWWGRGDTALADGTGTYEQRKWPCPNGFHVPSLLEWQNMITAGGWGSTNDAAMAATLLLPYSGRRTYSSAVVDYLSRNGHNWASSPAASAANAYFLRFFSSTLHVPADARSYGLAVRCFKNT